MNQPLVSVIVCTYNGERFLREQLDSIIAQTYPNIEVVISDDASTDGTRAVIESYLHHNHVHALFHEQNIGFVKNFEHAASVSRGELISFSDQDDIFVAHKIQRLVDEIGDYSLIYSDSELINEQGKLLGKKLSDVRRLKNSHDSRNFFMINAVSGHTMMVKRELLQHGLPIPEGFYHDWWLAIHAANEDGVKYLHEVLSYYRQHPKTVTKTLGKKNVPTRKLSERYEDFMKDIHRFNIIQSYPHAKHKAYFDKLYKVFLTKQKGYFSWPLFFFLFNNRNIIFTFWNKNLVSQIIEIRKLARGERDVQGIAKSEVLTRQNTQNEV